MLRALALTVVLIGCGGGSTEPTDSAAGDDDDGTSAFAPTSGDWVVSDESESGTCDFPEDTGDPQTTDDDGFTITDNGDGTFHLYDEAVDDEPGLDVTCTLTDKAFVCDANAMPVQDLEGMDASLLMSQNISGTFTDADNFTATAEMEVSCEGDDCPILADYDMILPCSITMSITANSDA